MQCVCVCVYICVCVQLRVCIYICVLFIISTSYLSMFDARRGVEIQHLVPTQNTHMPARDAHDLFKWYFSH